MPFEAARAIWEVTAGLIPGTADPKHTRRFGITSREWEGARDADGANGPNVLLLETFARATAYASWLQLLCASGREVNWVRIDFVWP